MQRNSLAGLVFWVSAIYFFVHEQALVGDTHGHLPLAPV